MRPLSTPNQTVAAAWLCLIGLGVISVLTETNNFTVSYVRWITGRGGRDGSDRSEDSVLVGNHVDLGSVQNLTGHNAVDVLTTRNNDHHHHQDTIKQQHIQFMDLLDWEIESIEKSSKKWGCPNRPKRIDRSCCLGITKIQKKVYNCTDASLDYHRQVRDWAMESMLQQQPATNNTTLDQEQAGNIGCDICRIMQLCLLHNTTLIFYGDSVTRQQINGLLCELQRRSYRVQSQTTQTNGQLSYQQTLTVTSSSSSLSLHDQPVKILFFNQQHIPEPADLESLPRGSVLVMNFGLHWAWGARRERMSPSRYNDTMHRLFRGLALHAERFRLIIHRETSAQHFDSNAGEFFLLSANSSQHCAVLRDVGRGDGDSNSSNSLVGWRELVVKSAASNNGFRVVTTQSPTVDGHASASVLYVQPFFNFTRQLHGFHPIGDGQQDCTHFCSSPYLWWPLWNSLRSLMDSMKL